MKIKFFAMTLFVVFCSFVVSAQNINCKIVKSEIFKDEYKHSDIELVEDDGSGGVFIVRSFYGGVFSSGFGYYFEHYDTNLKLIKEFEYRLNRSEVIRQSSVIGIITNGNDVSLIDFVYDKSQGAYICSALTSNMNDFNFKSKELFRMNSEEIKQFGFLSGGGFDEDSGASMIVNENKTAFAVTVDIKNKNNETHKLYLFDSSLNKRIDHTFKRAIKDRKFIYENIDVSKDGNTLYLLAKVYTEEKKKKKDGGRYQFELTQITKDTERTQVFDTEEHYSRSLKTIIFEDRVTCIGFYSDRNDNRYKGISYFELDPKNLEIKKTKFNPFTEQFMFDKYGKDKDKELKNLSFRQLLVTPSNEIVFNAEEFYTIVTTSTSVNGGSQSRTSYHYDDIVSAKINANGDIVWARNINKRQSTGGDKSFISYTSAVKGDDSFFFINTGEKVKKISKNRIQFGQTSSKKSNFNVIKISPNGDLEYKELLDDRDNEVPFMVSKGIVSGESVYFVGQKGKKKQLLKVTL